MSGKERKGFWCLAMIFNLKGRRGRAEWKGKEGLLVPGDDF